jgi:ligand-binding SRPBCC domain-containing protein
VRRVEQTSELNVAADALWAAATTVEGVNYELGPLLKMTVPRGAAELNIVTAPLNVPIGRSWLLLGGILPVDYDHLTLTERGPGLRFQERSTMASLKRWNHERTVVPDGEGRCRVTDRLEFEPRVPGTGRIAAAIVRFLFRHRHSRLARRYGA